MKTYNSLSTFLMVLTLIVCVASCKKELEEVIPQDRLSTTLALTDANAAQALYTGVYSGFRGYNGTLFSLGEMRSEIWADGLFTESGDPGSALYYNHNISALNVPAGNWANFYGLLYQINNVINLFPKSTVPAALRDKQLAEMYGMRAFVYYTMLKTWGGVPLTIEPITALSNAAETYKPRSKPDSILIQIKNDIQQSLTLFGSNNAFPSGNRVYWSRVATLILKGDVYLWSGTLMGGGTADITIAQAALQEVKSMEGATLKLNTNYTDIFDPTKKANNPEIVFALNYEINQATQGTFSIFTVNNIQAGTLAFQQSASPTVQSIYPYVNGANRVGMNAVMINKLTSGPADQRISGSFRVMYSNSSPFAIRGVMLTKWIGTTVGTTQVYNNDFPIYRYADVLLLMAEAKAKLGQDPSSEINQIRQRAYGSGYAPYVNGSFDANMKAILEEQLREFIGEGKRWWSLRRAGDAYVFSYINPAYLSPATVASPKGPNFLLPISTSMLNNDPLLTQTPGY